MANSKNIFFVFPLTISVLFVCMANAQSLFDQIGWRGADISIITGLVLTVISGVGIMILMHLQAKFRRQKNDRWHILFSEKYRKSGINRSEM
jgi:hypothetical protein